MRGSLTTVVVMLLTAVACESPKTTSTTEEGPEQLRFEESYVTTPDGVRLYVRVAGIGPDTVIVPAAAWLARDLGPLVPGRTLIFFDPRGRGASDAVLDTARLGLELEIGDIDFVREQFGIERMSLIGWSYLGAVVALYATEHPEHVKRVVQVGPMAPTTELARIEGVRAWGDLIPSAQLLEIEGIGHAPWLEAPDQFFKAVDEFLRGG